MRKGNLLWFFTLLCSQFVLYGLSADQVHALENDDSMVSKHPLIAREEQGMYGNGNVNFHTVGDGENIDAKDNAIATEKAQRGKGSYGGSDVVHRKPTQMAAASILESPFGLFLVLIVPHLIA